MSTKITAQIVNAIANSGKIAVHCRHKSTNVMSLLPVGEASVVSKR
jgi:hypothetical protein